MTALGILLIGCLGLLLFISFYPNVYKGVAVEGVDISGRSREEVAELLATWRKEYHNKSIMVYHDGTKVKVDASSIDLDIDVDTTLDEALRYGRTGSWWERIRKIGTSLQEGYPISLAIKYNKDKLNNLFEEWRGAIERPARNATFSMVAGTIIPQEQGYSLESDALEPLILETFKKPDNNVVTLPVKILYPKITVDDIASTGIKKILSSYTTTFNKQDTNRTANIQLAAWKTNGTILEPGKAFSFNEIVGPREKEYGFKEALEIVDGEFVPGVGGGICQVSSTLYNAAILANLSITERYNHSKPLSYVPLGRDATVAFGTLDFKFVNNTPGPLLIMAEVVGNKLIVGILGQQPLQEKVEIRTQEQEKILPSIIKKQDDSLYIGETLVDKEGKPGYAVTTIRLIQPKEGQIRKEVLSKDIYLADDTVVKVGTKKPSFAGSIESN